MATDTIAGRSGFKLGKAFVDLLPHLLATPEQFRQQAAGHVDSHLKSGNHAAAIVATFGLMAGNKRKITAAAFILFAGFLAHEAQMKSASKVNVAQGVEKTAQQTGPPVPEPGKRFGTNRNSPDSTPMPAQVVGKLTPWPPRPDQSGAEVAPVPQTSKTAQPAPLIANAIDPHGGFLKTSSTLDPAALRSSFKMENLRVVPLPADWPVSRQQLGKGRDNSATPSQAAAKGILIPWPQQPARETANVRARAR